MLNKVMLFVAISFFTGCGNVAVLKPTARVVSAGTNFSLVNPHSTYPLRRPVRLDFAVPPLASQESYRVVAYMKCCHTPVELSVRLQADSLMVDVQEFWSEGIYIFELSVVDAALNIVKHQQIDIEAN